MSLASDRERLLADRTLTGTAFSDAWRATVDAWLATCFEGAVARQEDPGRIALVAVGGYGRGDLAPGYLLLH